MVGIRKAQYTKKFLSLSSVAKSWLNISGPPGSRQGIYNITKLDKEEFLVASFVTESRINEDYQCLEKILYNDGYLPAEVRIPQPAPKAAKALFLIDTSKGICYTYNPGILSPIEYIENCLLHLKEDTQISQISPRTFNITETIIDNVTQVARKYDFLPYSSKGDLLSVEIFAKGDLDSNADWKRLKVLLAKVNGKHSTIKEQ
jgi:hypothetical protein